MTHGAAYQLRHAIRRSMVGAIKHGELYLPDNLASKYQHLINRR